jgi:hypothetical protein
MLQFDVYQNPNTQLSDRFPYLMILQHHDLSDIQTVVVAPLQKVTAHTIAKQKLNLIFDIKSEKHMLLPELMAAIDKKTLKKYVENLAESHLEIKQAIDILLGGV